MKLLKRIAILAVASAATLTLTATSASAQARTFTDGNQLGKRDIVKTDVDYGAGTLSIATNVQRIAAGDKYTVWVDTNSADAGPEYKMEMMPNSDYIGIWRVGSFSDNGKPIYTPGPVEGGGPTGTCLFYGWADIYGSTGTLAIFEVSRKCIGNPSKVRVTVRAKFNASTDYTDYLPAKEKFTPWVTYN